MDVVGVDEKIVKELVLIADMKVDSNHAYTNGVIAMMDSEKWQIVEHITVILEFVEEIV